MKPLSDEQKRINRINRIKHESIGNALKDNELYSVLREHFIRWTEYPELNVDDVSVDSTTIKGEFKCSTNGCENPINSTTIKKIIKFNTECKCPSCKKTYTALKHTKTVSLKGNTIGCISKGNDERADRAKQLINVFISFEDDKNIEIENCLCGSNYKAEWICLGRFSDQCEKTFKRAINHMTDIKRSWYCNKCSKQILVLNENKEKAKEKSLADLKDYQELISNENGMIFCYCVEWPELKPEEITPYSSYHIMWKCKRCNNYFDAIVSNTFKQNSRCPYCSGKKPLYGKNDLYTFALKNRPKLIDYWVESENGKMEDYTFSADKDAAWICAWCGTKYVRKICKNIKSNCLCGDCSNKFKDSIPQRIIYEYLKDALPYVDIKYGYRNLEWLNGKELDIYFEKDGKSFAIEYDGNFHKLEKDREKDKLCKNNNCTLIRVREPGIEKYDEGFDNNPHIIYRESNTIDDDLNRVIVQIFKILGINYDINKIDVKKDVYKALGVTEICFDQNRSLYKCKPNVAKYLDVDYYKSEGIKLSSHNIFANSNIPYRFHHFDDKTGKEHIWVSMPNNMHDNTNKPYTCVVCRNKYFQPGVNDFESLYPDLMEEWNRDKNNSIGVYPEKFMGAPGIKAHWICKNCGHKYIATMNCRASKHSGCSICKHKLARKPVRAVNSVTGEIINAESVSEMARILGYKQNTISVAIKNNKIIGKRYIVCEYIEEGRKKQIKYSSAAEASNDTKITINIIKNRIKTGKDYNGIYFYYPDIKEGWKVEWITT